MFVNGQQCMWETFLRIFPPSHSVNNNKYPQEKRFFFVYVEFTFELQTLWKKERLAGRGNLVDHFNVNERTHLTRFEPRLKE